MIKHVKYWNKWEKILNQNLFDDLNLENLKIKKRFQEKYHFISILQKENLQKKIQEYKNFLLKNDFLIFLKWMEIK